MGGHGAVYVGNPVDVKGRPDLMVAAVAAPRRLRKRIVCSPARRPTSIASARGALITPSGLTLDFHQVRQTAKYWLTLAVPGTMINAALRATSCASDFRRGQKNSPALKSM